MRKNLFIIFIFLSSICFSQHKAYNFKTYFKETGKFVEQPSRWNVKDWSILIGLTAATVGIMKYDDDIKREIIKIQDREQSLLMKFGTIYGSPFTPLVLGTALVLQGSANENRTNEKIGFEILQASSYSIMLVGLVKVSFGRMRPYKTFDQYNFKFMRSFKEKNLSFFSGHSVVAFTVSTVLAQNTNSDLLKVLYYLPAVITGVSRVYHNMHWTSDVFLGAAIGVFIGKFVTDLHQRNSSIPDNQPVQIINLSFSL